MPDRTGLPFGDTADFEAADRGLIDAGDPVVRNQAGRVIWDNGFYGFLTEEAPDTVHPSLWRQSTLVARQGLFEVTDGIYQVRGYDLSNMSVIEGDAGIIVIDPLISTETAAAALALYRKHRGDRPVVAVIHTHSHADHFGGVKGWCPRTMSTRAGCRSSRPRASSSTRSRRTSTPGPRWHAGRDTCTAPRCPAARKAGWEPGWARPPRPARSR
jgi:alkyl sulfatase BDS1-like metallo-beta-lactamase superfamily hydrolase